MRTDRGWLNVHNWVKQDSRLVLVVTNPGPIARTVRWLPGGLASFDVRWAAA